MSVFSGQKIKNLLTVFVLSGVFLLGLGVRNAGADSLTINNYLQPLNGTLTSAEWNRLLGYDISTGLVYSNDAPLGDFINAWFPAAMVGPLGIGIGPVNGGSARLAVKADGTNNILNLFDSSGLAKFSFLNNGNLGIGTSTPSQRLQVAGGIQLDGISYGVSPGESQLLALSTVGYVNGKVGGAGGITTGTTGQTLRHDGTGWVANSTLYNNGTNVGIGTTTPATKLQVYGNGTYSASFMNGNVGIGTTAPGATLPSVFTAASSRILEIDSPDSNGGSTGLFLRRADNLVGLDLWSNNGSGPAYLDSRWNADAGGGFRFRTKTSGTAVDAVTILGGGNVGIGTTVPNSKLTVYSGYLGWTYSAGDATTYAKIGNTLGDGVLKFVNSYTGTPTSKVFTFTGNSTELVTILNGGNVGINTSTPAHKLHVNGDAQFDDLAWGLSPGTSQTLALATVGYVNASLTNGTGPWAKSGTYIYPSTLTDNVGIGTTGPNYKLVVAGTTVIGSSLVGIASPQQFNVVNMDSGGGPSVGLQAKGNSGNNRGGFAVYADDFVTPLIRSRTAFWAANAGLDFRADPATGTIKFMTGGYNSDTYTRLFIDSANNGGNVGIGTTNPTSILSLGGDVARTIGMENSTIIGGGRSLTISAGGVQGGWNGEQGGDLLLSSGSSIGNGSSNIYFKTATAGAYEYVRRTPDTKMTILGNGNVGIGTTTPSQILHVHGGAQLDAISWGVSPGVSQTLALATVGYVNASLTNGTGPWARTAPYVYPGTLTDNVGIGVTNPGNKLDVTGNVGVNGILKGYGAASNNFFEGKLGINTLSAGASSLAVFGNASIGSGYLSNAAPADGLIVQGNVGIGVTNPLQALHVVGTMRIDGGAFISGNLSMASSTLIVNKITANTIDPLYTIKGIKYSTYASAIVGGVNEEYVGRLSASDFTKSGKGYEQVIDFSNIKEESDLWVWYSVVDFSDNNVEIFLTPRSSAAVMYSYIEGEKIIIKSDSPVDASLRLVGHRYDWKSWPTRAIDQNQAGGLVVE